MVAIDRSKWCGLSAEHSHDISYSVDHRDTAGTKVLSPYPNRCVESVCFTKSQKHGVSFKVCHVGCPGSKRLPAQTGEPVPLHFTRMRAALFLSRCILVLIAWLQRS